MWRGVAIAAVAVSCSSGSAGERESPAAVERHEVVVAAASIAEPAAPSDGCDQPSFADCPIAVDEGRNLDQLLDRAGASYEDRDFAVAFACADIAADLMPSSVEAHHLRGVALAGLGRFDSAQTAFALALALDPDDPETLAAAAHFYINLLPARRETTLVGLEHARRGGIRAASRWRRERGLRASLALLEAQALNDLGRTQEALPAVDEAISLAPDLAEARYERGVVLFNLCRFEDAREAFSSVLRQSPDDPYAHHYLGLIYERAQRSADAEAHFKRARKLAPDEFVKPAQITVPGFRAELDRAVAELSAPDRVALQGVALEVVEVPALDDLVAVSPPFAPTILGMFRGLPLGVDDELDEAPPRSIVFYSKNLARAVRTRAELDRQIRRTLQHEIGHLHGLDEDELRRRGLD
jgi:Flp pilus assembly protein TadD/predicted Zn-dependent protease with MMP-like domain